MPESLDPLAFLSALEKRWKRIAAVAVLAAASALVVSLLLPKKYEATVLLMVQPTVGGAASSGAMSPAYLDSLRSYEQFVESDGVLENLLRDTHLNEQFSGERFRRSALRAALIKGTRILQLSVRLGDPQRAHEAALRLAQIAVESNARVNLDEAMRARGTADRDAAEAHKAMVAAQEAIDKFRSQSREDEISRDVQQQIERKERYQRDLSDEELELAEKVTLDSASLGNPAMRYALEASRARRDALRGAIAGLEKELVKSQSGYAELQARHAALDNEFQAAEERFSMMSRRATDVASNSNRREELEIADPGTVPTQPVSPNPLQNTILAAMLGLLAAVLYEAWLWNAGRAASVPERSDDRRPTAARW